MMMRASVDAELFETEDDEMPENLKESSYWPIGLKFTMIGSIFADAIYLLLFFVMILFLFILLLTAE